jgi:hypothetical protein
VVRSTLTLLTPHTGSLFADQQKKRSDTYQQGKQNTDDERNNPMPMGLISFDPAPFCAAPIPSQKRRLPTDRYRATKFSHFRALAKPADC